MPVLGRWFEFEPLVWLSLSHFGVEDHPNYDHQDHFWADRAVFISLRRRRVTQNTFRPVGLRLPSSGVKGHQ
jgi:hypothetical protein